MNNEVVILLSFFACMAAFLFCLIYPFFVGYRYWKLKKNPSVSSEKADSYAAKGAVIEMIVLTIEIIILVLFYKK